MWLLIFGKTLYMLFSYSVFFVRFHFRKTCKRALNIGWIWDFRDNFDGLRILSSKIKAWEGSGRLNP